MVGNIGDVKKNTYGEDIVQKKKKKDATFWLNKGANLLYPLIKERGPKEI